MRSPRRGEPVTSDTDHAYAATFPARRDAFVRLRAFVEEACASAAVRRADELRVMLLVEELFVNTIEHGHGQDCDAPVHVALTVTPAAIAVEYADTARPFNPLAVAEDAVGETNIDPRGVGGLGIRMIRTMAEDVGYACGDGWNRIRFRVPRSV
jgi:serine/threonine-protein kinase RsbW